MTHVRIIRYNKKYEVLEPISDFNKSFGYVMVCNSKGEVLKFFRKGATTEAIKYFDYISLSRLGKLKYWLNYKRDG